MPRALIPTWLRRGFEAALVAAVVAIASLAGDRLGTGGGPYTLPAGLTGALLLAPAVFALGVLPAAYPIAMAPTRADALLGAAAGWLLAVDFTILLTGGQVTLERAGLTLPTGVVVGTMSLLGLLSGIVASQLAVPFGFGRRAGAVAALGSAIGAFIALALAGLVA
jgi:hypothetical protein